MPPIQYSCTLWSNEEIEDLLKQDLYELYMKVYKSRNVGPMLYFIAKMGKPPPSDSEADPSQWEVMMLKGEKNDYNLNETWVKYLKRCVNLAFLIRRNASEIHLCIGKHNKAGRIICGT
jgi:hypothetical protein